MVTSLQDVATTVPRSVVVTPQRTRSPILSVRDWSPVIVFPKPHANALAIPGRDEYDASIFKGAADGVLKIVTGGERAGRGQVGPCLTDATHRPLPERRPYVSRYVGARTIAPAITAAIFAGGVIVSPLLTANAIVGAC